MKILLIVVAALVCFGILAYCFEVFIWSSTKCKTAPCITFNAFKKLYPISPDKWSFWMMMSDTIQMMGGWALSLNTI